MSTFALDVDTGSYTVTRRWLDEGSLPPIESVRPEEYINAFHYDYREPRRGLDVTIDGGPSPFDSGNYLVRVGVQGEVVEDADRGPAALTFVVDTSGSMDRDDRLGLVKRSLEILVDELEDDDTVAIVTYDDQAGVVLAPTEVAERATILDAIDALRPGGSTNLEAGLRSGYDARQRGVPAGRDQPGRARLRRCRQRRPHRPDRTGADDQRRCRPWHRPRYRRLRHGQLQRRR